MLHQLAGYRTRKRLKLLGAVEGGRAQHITMTGQTVKLCATREILRLLENVQGPL